MFGHERYRVRVCIESLHPSNDYSFHAMRKLQPIEARRGEERRGEDPQQRGSNNSDPLFPRPLWISKRNLDGQRVRFGASHGFDRIHHPTERFVFHLYFVFNLWDTNVLYVGEFLIWQLRKTGWPILWWIVEGGSPDRWINFKEVIFPWKNYIIPFPRIRSRRLLF